MNFMFHILPKKKVDLTKLEEKKRVQPVLPTVKKEDNIIEKKEGEYEILEREIMPERIICPYCGGYTLEGLDFCDKCGKDLTNL